MERMINFTITWFDCCEAVVGLTLLFFLSIEADFGLYTGWKFAAMEWGKVRETREAPRARLGTNS